MTCVLSLDIAMGRTGWAVGQPVADARFSHGVFETENWSGNEGRNLVAFRKHLESLRSLYPLTHVAIEQVFVDVSKASRFQFNGTQGQMMLSGVALEWAYRSSIKAAEVNIDEWRKRFLGLNRKPKESRGDDKYWKTIALKRAAELGYWCEHHDEAEAIGILDAALAALDKPYRLRTNPREARAQADIDNKRGIHA